MNTNNKEIDLIGLLKVVLAEKKLLAIFLTAFGTLGIINALMQQKEYTATVTLAPEATNMGMSSNLSDIAGMVGLNVGGGGNSIDAIYPEIYPEVFASTDFIVKLFNISITKNDGIKTTYYKHIKDDTRPSLMGGIKEIFKIFGTKKQVQEPKIAYGPKQLSKEEDNICSSIRSKIGCQINKATNVITIYAIDYDPVVSATIADTLQSRLQNYITLYRTQKARQDLAYAQKLNNEAKAKYVKARQRYASFSDSNTDVMLQSIKSVQEELENDMQLKFNNYNETSIQIQKAVAKVQERTPAFTIIQQAIVPHKSSSTPRSFIVLGFLFLGAILDTLWVLIFKNKRTSEVKK